MKLLLIGAVLPLGALALATVSIESAQAQNAYSKQQYNQTNSGGYFRSVNGQTNLQLPSVDPGKKIFITKEMWLLDASGNWVETGTVKGYTSEDGLSPTTVYWAGEYYASQQVVNGVQKYKRTLVGTSGSTGSKTFNVYRDPATQGPYAWNFYVNGLYVGQVSHPKGSFPYAQVGIETNNGCTNYTSGTYSDSLYILPPGSGQALTKWGTNVINADNKKIASWASTYNSTTQRVTFTSGAKPAGCP
jgi:hypothetical protein